MALSGNVTRLGALEMFDYAFHAIANELEMQRQLIEVEAIEPEANGSVYGATFNFAGKTIVLLSPACDLKETNVSVSLGTTPLSQVLDKIKKLEAKKMESKYTPDITYIVPLAECGTTFGMQRQHWTKLVIKGNEVNLKDPHHNRYYSFSALNGFLEAADFERARVNYLEWQDDDINCGRYTGYSMRDDVRAMCDKSKVEKPTVGTVISDCTAAPDRLKVSVHYSKIAKNRVIQGLRQGTGGSLEDTEFGMTDDSAGDDFDMGGNGDISPSSNFWQRYKKIIGAFMFVGFVLSGFFAPTGGASIAVMVFRVIAGIVGGGAIGSVVGKSVDICSEIVKFPPVIDKTPPVVRPGNTKIFGPRIGASFPIRRPANVGAPLNVTPLTTEQWDAFKRIRSCPGSRDMKTLLTDNEFIEYQFFVKSEGTLFSDDSSNKPRNRRPSLGNEQKAGSSNKLGGRRCSV